jgi:hypothetical protein
MIASGMMNMIKIISNKDIHLASNARKCLIPSDSSNFSVNDEDFLAILQ